MMCDAETISQSKLLKIIEVDMKFNCTLSFVFLDNVI